MPRCCAAAADVVVPWHHHGWVWQPRRDLVHTPSWHCFEGLRVSCFDGCGTVAPRSSTGSSGQAAILLLCGSVNSSSYSPAGCCCVVGGTPAQSPGESPAARGLSATACGAIFHTGCLTLFRSGCWMAGCAVSCSAPATPPSGSAISHRAGWAAFQHALPRKKNAARKLQACAHA